MPLKHAKDRPSIVVERGRKPNRGQVDLVRFEGFDFVVKRRQVLCSPVVGKPSKSELGEQRGSLFRSALLGIEGHDAPGHQVFASVEFFGRCRFGSRRARNADNEGECGAEGGSQLRDRHETSLPKSAAQYCRIDTIPGAGPTQPLQSGEWIVPTREPGNERSKLTEKQWGRCLFAGQGAR